MKRFPLAAPLLVTCVLLGACGPSNGPVHAASAATKTSLRYGVEGMHCDGCVQAITDKVRRVDGVIECSVNLQAKQADVVVRDRSLAPAVQQAIEKLGYKVTPEAAPATPAAPTTASK